MPAEHPFQAELDEALAALPSKQREVVRLHYLAGHTYAEIARRSGCRANNGCESCPKRH